MAIDPDVTPETRGWPGGYKQAMAARTEAAAKGLPPPQAPMIKESFPGMTWEQAEREVARQIAGWTGAQWGPADWERYTPEYMRQMLKEPGWAEANWERWLRQYPTAGLGAVKERAGIYAKEEWGKKYRALGEEWQRKWGPDYLPTTKEMLADMADELAALVEEMESLRQYMPPAAGQPEIAPFYKQLNEVYSAAVREINYRLAGGRYIPAGSDYDAVAMSLLNAALSEKTRAAVQEAWAQASAYAFPPRESWVPERVEPEPRKKTPEEQAREEWEQAFGYGGRPSAERWAIPRQW